MGEFVRLILEIVQLLWPLRVVAPWERGGYLVCGHWWRDVGPGIYAVVPWFMDVHAVSVVPAIVGTPRQDITLADGSTLSFTATATVCVTDVRRAVTAVDNFHETTQELLGAVLADRLAQVGADRLASEKRGRLLADLSRWVREEAADYGVEVSKIRFTSCVLNVRTLRLLQEGGAEGW